MSSAGGAAPSSGAVAPGSAAPEMPEVTLDAVTMKQVEAEAEKTIPMMSYYAVAMTAMFLLFGSMFGAFAFVKERREQTLARMLVTPATKTQIVGGKGLGIALVGVGQLAVLLVGTTVLFRIDWGQHIEAAVLLGVAEVFAATGLAMTLAALGKTERVIGAIGPAAIMVFAATGGSMFPAEAMPTWMKPAQVISPSYWALEGFLDVIKGATVADVAGKAGIVVVIGLVLYAFGVWRLRYE
jgi:ABC-2 type transport system permease protein